jgi:hypothetical protein
MSLIKFLLVFLLFTATITSASIHSYNLFPEDKPIRRLTPSMSNFCLIHPSICKLAAEELKKIQEDDDRRR